MTTDELRAWMKALEERDVRIVALEKDMHSLTLCVSELKRQLDAAKTPPEVPGAELKPWAFGPTAPVSFELKPLEAIQKANLAAAGYGCGDIWDYASRRRAAAASPEMRTLTNEAILQARNEGLKFDARQFERILGNGWAMI